MNEVLMETARNWLKENLVKCMSKQRSIFKKMYSPNDLELPINAVVDNMREDELDWAMTQVKNTLNKNKEERNEA